MNILPRLAICAFMVSIATTAPAQVFPQGSDEVGRPLPSYHRDDSSSWREQELPPPSFPQAGDLIEFEVSAANPNRYFIDGSTLTVGADGVVRYVLVVRTVGGASNISLEGMRCKERLWKLYASGRADGTWAIVAADRATWQPIENKPVRRHHAALSRDYLCPNGIAIKSADEGRNALRRGRHPDAN